MADVIAIIATLAKLQGFRLDQDANAIWFAIDRNGNRWTIGRTPQTVSEINSFIHAVRESGMYLPESE